ncbi:hypothetical protein [Sphingomonas sp. S6]|jgi:hypothetical protein|nr:hypothetical protein [uncultured Sphingomonas sp.]
MSVKPPRITPGCIMGFAMFVAAIIIAIAVLGILPHIITPFRSG